MNVSDEQITGFISERSLVCIRRDEIDSRSWKAFPLAFSDQLLLVQYIYDFRVDGQLIFRRNDVTSITCRATDQFQRRLLKDNGLIQQIDFDFKATLSSFSALLESQSPSSIVILEKEGLDDPMFWIGRHIDSNEETRRLHEFSGAAN